MSFRTIFVMVVLASLVAGCGPALYVPTVDHVSPGASLEVLHAGRLLYTKRCNSCHNLYQSEQFTEDQWRKIIIDMQGRAKLTKQDTELIQKYLIAGITFRH